MALTEPELWSRIEQCSFDADVPQPMSKRIQLKHGHSAEFVRDLVLELKRLYYLFAICSRVVPSKLVRRAWEEHVLDTRAYAPFCRTVFSQILHHEPITGVDGEAERLQEGYLETLKVYATEFDVAPPKEFWPSRWDTLGEVVLHASTRLPRDPRKARRVLHVKLRSEQRANERPEAVRRNVLRALAEHARAANLAADGDDLVSTLHLG